MTVRGAMVRFCGDVIAYAIFRLFVRYNIGALVLRGMMEVNAENKKKKEEGRP